MEVYTDGSRIPGIDGKGYAGAGIWFGLHDNRNTSVPINKIGATNQFAELLAVLYALTYCKDVAVLRICTDSKYTIGCLTQWSRLWKQNNWKTSKNTDVINKDVIAKCINILEYRDIQNYVTEFIHVTAHKGIIGNEEADVLARTGALLSESRIHLF